MKALLRKEFREILWLGALGLVVCGLLLLYPYFTFKEFMHGLALGQTDVRGHLVQPLVERLYLVMIIGYFCAIFAAVIGCLQVLPERLRNLWGFLLHRPITPTGIFLGKTIVGLGVYLVAAGLPLIGFIAWTIVPGNVPAPFEWSLLLPPLAFYLAGIPFYFAGMLTGLRQARWYASRLLGLGAGLILSVGVFTAPHYWQALLVILLGTAVLGVAAWGSFQTDGFYRGQPAIGRRALTLTVALGGVVVAFFIGVMLADQIGRVIPKLPPAPWSYYLMTKDGALFKVTETEGQPAQINDLKGNPAKDDRTGALLTLPELEQKRSWRRECSAGDEDKPRLQFWWFPDFARSYRLLEATPQTLWYYRAVGGGRLVGYDVATGRLVGSLGPKGFATDLVGAGDAFTTVHWRTLATETALYHADLQNRSVKQIFSTDPQDMILGVQEVGRERNAWDYTLVLTRQFVRLLTPEGVEVLKAPFEPGYPDCRQVELSLLEPNGRFALWMEPYYLVNEKTGWKLPTHVTWYDGGRKTASVELPPIPRSYEVSFSEEKVESLLLPPVLIAALPGFLDGDRMAREWRIWLFISLAFSVVVCLPVGYWLTRRNALPRSAQLGWSVFLLLFGFPGLLALLSVEEWPARVPCPNCKKRRVVSREHCEHCGAKFSPPEKRGIEIFDAAGA